MSEARAWFEGSGALLSDGMDGDLETMVDATWVRDLSDEERRTRPERPFLLGAVFGVNWEDLRQYAEDIRALDHVRAGRAGATCPVAGCKLCEAGFRTK